MNLSYNNKLKKQIKFSVFEMRIVELLLLLSVAFCLLAQIISLFGGSFFPISEWTQTYFSYSTSFGSYVTLFRYVSQFFLVAVLVYVLVERGVGDPLLVLVSVSGFIVYFAIELAGGGDAIEVVFGSIPLTVFLIPLFVLLGQDTQLSGLILKWSMPLAYFCFIISGLVTLWFRLTWGWNMEFGDFPGRSFYSYGICSMWVACFAVFAERDSQKRALLLLCVMGLLFGLFLNVRSWVLQCAVAFLFVYLLQARERAIGARLTKALVLLVAIVAVATVLFPSAFETFGARFGDDTRTGQYEVFFDQVDHMTLLFGMGSNASYSYGSNANYKYFDNQLVFIAFHYGMVPVLCFLYVLLRALFGKREQGLKSGVRYIAVAWFAAIVGVSTYFSYEMNYFIISLMAIIGTGIWSPPLSESKSDKVISCKEAIDEQ